MTQGSCGLCAICGMMRNRERTLACAGAAPPARPHIYPQGGDVVDKDVTQQILDVIASLRRAEEQARQMLRTARAQRLSFGLTYNYIDEDIAQVLGRLRYMQLIAVHQADQQQAVRRDGRLSASLPTSRRERAGDRRGAHPYDQGADGRN